MSLSTSPTPNVFVLYYHPLSLCSLMSRFTISARGQPKDAASEMLISEELVNIFDGGQLTEEYLVDIHPKGQVPVLASKTGWLKPITNSTDISLYIAERYPSLMPSEYAGEIQRLLNILNEINYFSLTHKPAAPALFKNLVEQKLTLPDISPRYRTALESKLEVTMKEKVESVLPDKIAVQEKLAKAFFADVEPLVAQANGNWLFGDTPTVIDTHLAVFLNRLSESGRGDMIPERLLAYLAGAKASPAWQIFTAEGK